MTDTVVFAREYVSELGSRKQFVDFNAWAGRELPEQVSAWRTRRHDGQRWFLIVVDESGGRAFEEFAWSGQPFDLSLEAALSFVDRRRERLIAGYLAGERGRMSETIHYGEAAAPRVRADGSWEIPAPGRG